MKSRNFKKLFLFYAILFLLCGLSFIFQPNFTINIINKLGQFQSYFTPLELSQSRFWVVLTFSMMMMVSYASYMVYKSNQTKAFISILLLSKLVSSATYGILLFTEQRSFAYLVGFVVDGIIFLSILFVRDKIEQV